MSAAAEAIVLEDVSKFYGDVLGVNRVDLQLGPGITSLVGPNGAGKTTLLNLLTGLVRPTRGHIQVLGMVPARSQDLFRHVGYCSQHDAFPAGFTARQFVASYLRLHGYSSAEAARLAADALRRVGMTAAADRKIASYSKGMRQRTRLAQALAHGPRVLILDEPLNGLDPLARAEAAALFRDWAGEGRCLLIASHILHEVDALSHRVILLRDGYIVGEGGIGAVRQELHQHPLQILVRCDRPAALAARSFTLDSVLEARLTEPAAAEDGSGGVLIRTRHPEQFFLALNEWVAAGAVTVETVAPVDDNLDAVYRFLVGPAEGSA